jgi:hypothetical protein
MNGDAIWLYDERDIFVMVPIADWYYNVASDLEAILTNPPKFICVNNATKNTHDRSEKLLNDFLIKFNAYLAKFNAYF